MRKGHIWHNFIKRKIIFVIDRVFSIFDKSILTMQRFFVKKNLKSIKSDYEFFLVTGCSRSGTTLLETILSTHPGIKSPLGEFDFSSINFEKEINKNLERLKERKKANQIEKAFREFSGNKKLLVKRPNANLYIDLLKKSFSGIKIIDIVRDGRDVAASAKKSPHLTWPVGFSARQWKKIVNKSEGYKNKPNFIQVKYEDLINNPLETVNSIFRFLNLNEIRNIEKFYEKEEIKNNKKADNSNRPLNMASIGKWKKEITPKEKKIFMKIAGKELIKLGYEKDNNW